MKREPVAETRELKAQDNEIRFLLMNPDLHLKRGIAILLEDRKISVRDEGDLLIRCLCR